MGAISDLAVYTFRKTGRVQRVPWREELLPASFRGAMFHCESGSRENGRADGCPPLSENRTRAAGSVARGIAAAIIPRCDVSLRKRLARKRSSDRRPPISET